MIINAFIILAVCGFYGYERACEVAFVFAMLDALFVFVKEIAK